MIVKDKELESQPEYQDDPLLASGSGVLLAPPPPFEDEPTESQHLLVDLGNSNETLEPPPEFEPYEAEYFEIGSGNIVSHDPHLNTDGEALYRFLLGLNTAPSYRLHCRGTHIEHRTRWVAERSRDGRSDSRRESYTESIIDFDFYIDIEPPTAERTVQWSVADAEPAYRGLMVREVELPEGKRAPEGAKIKAYKKWLEERRARGLPPWVMNVNDWIEGAPASANTLRSSKTVRQWADEYCASSKYLKEFVYERVLYGWNLQHLESAVRSSINATMYHGCLEVELETCGSKVYVRPDNKISRMLSNKWLKLLSIIVLIFPFIWLFKRFHSRGGGRWEICGNAYALKKWVPVEEGECIDEQPYNNRTSREMPPRSSRLMLTPMGTTKLVGLREVEWFRKWESTIIRAVMGKYQSSTPIFEPDSSFMNS